MEQGMEEQIQQEFLQYVAHISKAETQEDLEKFLEDLGEEGVNKLFEEFMQAREQQEIQKARFGAKLKHIYALNDQCPAGMEMRYFKEGGKVCKTCVQKEMKNPNNSEDIYFGMYKDSVNKFKKTRKK